MDHEVGRRVPGKELPSINKSSTPFSVLIVYLTGVIQWFVEQTNLYYRQYLDALGEGPSSSSLFADVTVLDIFLYFTVTIQMGHDL
jgi:hypothetical protein